MDAMAKLITALAALLGAIAWPLVFITILLTFQNEIRLFASRFPAFVDRLRKMKVAGVEAELDALADKASSNGEVTADQTRAAAQIAIDSREISREYLFAELDKLCLQYDTVRQTMLASSSRTQEMTRIIVKLRALAPSTSSRIAVYKGSVSAGSRLAAIAMMQMEPACADLDWLLERFRVEAPFLFYHAALALTNAANSRSGTDKQAVIEVALSALKTVRSYDGVHEGTLHVLEALTAR